MKYLLKRKWKYKLFQDEMFYIPGINEIFTHDFYKKYFSYTAGLNQLIIKEGYCSDGPTWFADLKKAMRGSFCHDALTQLAQRYDLGYYDRDDLKVLGDEYFKQCLLEDGMHPWLAKRGHWLVSKGAGYKSLVKEAP